MSRRRAAEKRQILPDPIYNSIVLNKFINEVMVGGKKTIAQKIVYGALDIIQAQNQNESDVDCGGICGSNCALGATCNNNDDCLSLNCSGNQCVAPQCNDGIQNADETGIDCGGSLCGACPPEPSAGRRD